MSFLGPTLVIYLLIGAGIAVAVYVSSPPGESWETWLRCGMAIPFWPIYLPFLLAGTGAAMNPTPRDTLTTTIAQVDAELETVLNHLEWLEEEDKGILGELRAAWSHQAKRIREMDRTLAMPELDLPLPDTSTELGGRLQVSEQNRLQNMECLQQVRQQAYNDLIGMLAWVRELVSMIHLARFTGAPAARAEELLNHIAAAVDDLSVVHYSEDGAPVVDDQSGHRYCGLLH